MKPPTATSSPSSSGARITGDDLQHLIVWYWCLRAITAPDDIISVAVEADDAGNVDDVVVSFANGTSIYIQVKATVSGAKLANVAWLIGQRQPSRSTGRQPSSLVQKLHRSWVGLGRPTSGLELITGRPADGEDEMLALLDRRNSVGPGLRRATGAHLIALRKELATHLGCYEEELCDFFDALAIRTGQNEGEWIGRVNDVAAAAGIKADTSSTLTGLGWIRTWVKDTRDPRTPGQIRAAARELGLVAEPPRTVVVVQGLREEPVGDAHHVLNWIDHFRGDEASNRRGLHNPDDWNGALSEDLARLRHELLTTKRTRVLVRGALRLPGWFGVGSALSSVSGFDFAIEYRNQVWTADQSAVTGCEVVVLDDEVIGSGRTLVVVAISTNRSEDVRATLRSEEHGRVVTLTTVGGPDQALLSDASDTASAAIAVRDWVRTNAHGSDIDLVLMAPAPFAAFLGWCWDRMPDTTIHEDLLDGYEAAFTISNRIGPSSRPT